MLLVQSQRIRKERLIDLVVDAQQFPGTLQFVLPPPLFPENPKEQAREFSLGAANTVHRWVERHTEDAQRLFQEAKFPAEQHALLIAGMRAVAHQRPLSLRGGQVAAMRNLTLTPRHQHAVFIRVDVPERTEVGSSFTFDVTQQDSATGRLQGGSRYQVVVNRPAE